MYNILPQARARSLSWDIDPGEAGWESGFEVTGMIEGFLGG